MEGKKKIMTKLPAKGKITLMTFAGNYRYLTAAGCVLSGISAVVALFPYLCMWNVVKEVVLTWQTGLNGPELIRWGVEGSGLFASQHADLFLCPDVHPSVCIPYSQEYEDRCPSPPDPSSHRLF